ncbi:MAG: hypothetical protein PSW75_00275 [bacterium]|nr:hypothetical protein [bacterium]MDI1336482.1 hypothetical protein [Lacunisphaera sp.]
MTAESTTLTGNAGVTGDLLVPGTPTVRLNGSPNYGGTQDGTGSATPINHTVTLNGGASLRHIIRRTDGEALRTVAAPPQPAGTRSVSLNNTSQSPGDFTTLKNLTLNSNAGQIVVPPGTYGNFTANSGSGFVFGAAGANTPAVYNFQNLTLNGNSPLAVIGPVVVTINGGFSTNSDMGASAHPEWLELRIAGGGLSLNGNALVYAKLAAPDGTLALNGNTALTGSATADQLIINGKAVLRLVERSVEPPPFPDADHDGMDDTWETAYGLNPMIDDSNFDNDNDGVPNSVEFRLGLKPNNPDTDGDGLYDGDELALGLDPTVYSPDNQSPTVPTGLTKGPVTTDSITLSWQAASDNLKVSGYIVYRDGQPITTDLPIRETTFTDTNLPDGEELTYQVRAFDFAGNLSPLGAEISVTTIPTDTDHDGLPDEWEQKYFGEEPCTPGDDPDGDGQTNLQEFQAGTNPKDFYNGVKPVTEALNGEPGNQLATKVLKPDGTPWINAPVSFDSSKSRRQLSLTPGGPFDAYQIEARTGPDGIARCYLEPLQP